METLGLSGGSSITPGPDPKTSTIATVRQAVMVLGGLLGSGTVVFALVDLVREQPDKAFALLKIWGPWFILALFAVWALNGLLAQALRAVERLGDRVCDSFDKVAVEQKRLADSQEVLAAAAKSAAEKDDRERDRMATEIGYTSAQSREAAAGVRALTTIISSMAEQVAEIHKKTG